MLEWACLSLYLHIKGGGQPADIGMIQTENGLITVSHVRRDALTALHRVSEPIEPNVPVTLSIDWKRRFDHMQQHSGQHLISAILDQQNVPTLGWSLGEKISYIEIGKKLSEVELQEVEDKCNEVIRKGVDIWMEIPDKDLVNKKKLPDDYDAARGVLRVIHIGEMDANA